jgi:hypothetical protein
MATLQHLVQTLARATRIPEATVFAYGRFARESGWIAQSGRGKSAAKMTERDAANLLIAVASTDVTREAGRGIERFRPLQGKAYAFNKSLKPLFLDTFYALNLKPMIDGTFSVEANLGQTIEFLIGEAGKGRLHQTFSQIPCYDVSSELWKKWRKEKSANLGIGVDEMVTNGLVEVGFNKQITIQIDFIRNMNVVQIDVMREWGGHETVFSFEFTPEEFKDDAYNRHFGFRAIGRVNEISLTGLGLALAGELIEDDCWPVDFFDLFGIEEIPAVEHALHTPSASEAEKGL